MEGIFMRFYYLFLFSALITLSLSLQTPALEESTDKPQESKKEDGKKETKSHKGVQEKAVRLLYEVVADAQTLKLPENRILMQINAAELLWKHDQRLSLALIAEVMSALN